MEKAQKERVVAELTERLRTIDTLIVADYRGLTNKELEALRARLAEHGARFSVVKNTLTRRAAEAAGAEQLLTLLEGPTGIAFIEVAGEPASVAKALADTARETKLLALRGGLLEGRSLSGEQVDVLAKLPPVDILQGQVLGAITAPLTQVVALLSAPLTDLVGLIDARIEQLGGADAVSGSAGAEPLDEPAAALADETATEAAGAQESGDEDLADSASAESATETATEEEEE
jgi:large subunit ribosomal protein L10